MRSEDVSKPFACHISDIFFMYHIHIDPKDGSSLYLRKDAQPRRMQSVFYISFRTVGQQVS
jgi:hypothetical protein